MATVLIADDERAICQAFSQLLRAEGHHPVVASTGKEALAAVERERPDALFLDVQMPGMSGLETLAVLRERHPELPVVVMTAYGTLDTAMEAVRLGAFDYIGKPVELDRVRQLLRRALHRPAGPGPDTGAPTPAPPPPGGALVGQSAAMQEIFKLMGLLTGNDLTVLLTGESGVGKELVARGIHSRSPRRQQPFVAVNCAAIPESLAESELFGHERGAFTGAEGRRVGRFEAAGAGTLFLDEVTEMPLLLQGKLLRVLQERSFERVGSVAPVALGARVIAASNRDLEREVADGRFREDLYHRLKLVTLYIPPLRERRDDIALLAQHFLAQANAELGRRVAGIEPAALERLRAHRWPGNVRELEHAIKRAVLLARGETLSLHDLEPGLPAAQPAAGPPSAELEPLRVAARAALREAAAGPPPAGESGLFHRLVASVERALIDEALRLSGGSQVAAARLLGLHRTTLRNKLEESDPPSAGSGRDPR
jgi:nitrogen regulation protein NR(I)